MQWISGGGGRQNIHMSSSYPSASNAWTVAADNINNGTIVIQAVAICTK